MEGWGLVAKAALPRRNDDSDDDAWAAYLSRLKRTPNFHRVAVHKQTTSGLTTPYAVLWTASCWTTGAVSCDNDARTPAKGGQH
mmetsp:Transcript_3269/g.5741  ORF Transcript_3269/g.5741 Transcript_3269/m.5741 type:complete len:84 (+) Transcript_3269:331-582(+)|eukprot:CAMPEP_0197461280 /NCGR_PEP_ID=MMETSP1175-20131217/56069_1 /TAXON_ID=1003142 /ORGANISM="Triceratium dubium, Strain CCMP147" /LENGTH=83 /DNA_ID=CAMNT_0042996525 /DNA_START=321 /DNA_END=572 /DNA_ORIENTATION=-